MGKIKNGRDFENIEEQVDAMVIIALCDPNNIYKSSDEIAESMFNRLMDGQLTSGKNDVNTANKRFLDIKSGILDRLYGVVLPSQPD